MRFSKGQPAALNQNRLMWLLTVFGQLVSSLLSCLPDLRLSPGRFLFSLQALEAKTIRDQENKTWFGYLSFSVYLALEVSPSDQRKR